MKFVLFIFPIFLLIAACDTQPQTETQNIDSSVKQESNTIITTEKTQNESKIEKFKYPDIEKISIVDYSKSGYSIIVTEISPEGITVGPIDEESGDFIKESAKIKDTTLIYKLLKIFPLETYYKSERIGQPCSNGDFFIGLSFKKNNEAQQNLTFVNYFDSKLYKGIQEINKTLPDSLEIEYDEGLTQNCE